MAKEKKSKVSEKIMEAILEDEVKMKPRIYFILGSVLLALGLLGLVLGSVMLVHMISFRLRVHAPFDYLRFGREGFRPFMSLFPWIPLVLSFLAMVGGAKLLKKYDISYRRSFSGMVVAMMVLILVLGILIDKTRLGNRIASFEGVRGAYLQKFRDEDWVAGEIVEVGENSVVIMTPFSEETEVVWDDKTFLPVGAGFVEGDMVRAVGNWEDDQFLAKGIMKGRMDMRYREDFGPGRFPRRGEVRGKMHLGL